MNKEQKATVVDELSKELSESEAIFAIDYRGISVPQAAELRAGLRDADARFRVVKNRLTLLAAEKAGTAELTEHLEGPTALALVRGDAAAAAKTIFKLGREWEVLSYKGGLMSGEVLDEDSFEEIARLPGRDQLDAQFAGIVASPLTGLVRGLGSMVQGLALQLQGIADQGLVSGESAAEEMEAPKEDDAPAGGDDEKASADEGDPAEDAPSDEAGDGPSGEADPDPKASPEEAPSEEEAPAGEETGGGDAVEETGEGDAEMGEAAEEAQGSGDSDGGEDTSEDSDDKEEGS